MNTPLLGLRLRSGLFVAALAVLVGLTLFAGCGTLRSWTPSGRKAEATRVALQQQQARNMRFADEYVGRLIEAENLTRPSLADADQRMMISGWLLSQANAAYISASGENPITGTLDLLAVAALSRMMIESWLAPRYPAQTEPLLAAHRKLEANAWELASTVLDSKQKEAARNLLIEWYKRNPDFRNVMYIRFQDFVNTNGEDTSKISSTGVGGLLGLIGLDPLAGLDPAVQEVELSRLLAARVTYYAQRIPTLLDLQLDRSLNRLTAAPASKALQQQVASLTQSATRFATVAEGLPDAIVREREALVRQMSDSLIAQEVTLRPMLLELRGAFEDGGTMATLVNQAVRSIDALAARFSKEPGSAGTGAGGGKPFDINDYTRAAAEITRAANEVQLLLGSMGTQRPQIEIALDASVSKGRSLIDYLFVRIVWLIAIVLAGILATLFLYRWFAPCLGRLADHRGRPRRDHAGRDRSAR